MRSIVIKLLFLMFVMPLVTMAGNVTVASVTANQRDKWSGLVDIVVTMHGAVDDVAFAVCIFAATNSANGFPISVDHITRDGDDIGAGSVWTRKFVWNPALDIGMVKIDNISLSVGARIPGVQLWENGPCWAEWNVGATKPEEYGYYFWWGDTVGYKREEGRWKAADGSRNSFSFDSGACLTDRRGSYELNSLGYTDSKGNLVAAHDAATMHLGAIWHMPTDAELSELINNCDTEWVSQNGVNGRLVKGRGAYASKSIFLPAAGYGEGFNLDSIGSYCSYWSSTVYSGHSWYRWFLSASSSSEFELRNYEGYYGKPIRPLRNSPEMSSMVEMVTVHLMLDCRIAGRVAVTCVTAQRRTPWDGFVDIVVTIQGEEKDVVVSECSFSACNSENGLKIPVAHISRQGADSGAGCSWTRHYVWDAISDIRVGQIDEIALTVNAEIPDGVQLWENGPYWAESNVGAYFGWGDTVGYQRTGSWDYGKWIALDGSGSYSEFPAPLTSGKDNPTLKSLGFIDSASNLVAKYDAATILLGVPWRMPTADEFSALVANCTFMATSSGLRVTGKGDYASKSVVFPLSGLGDSDWCLYSGQLGCYWTSTSDGSNSARYFGVGSRGVVEVGSRNYGMAVRPVRGFIEGETFLFRWKQESTVVIRDGCVLGWDGPCPEHLVIPEGVQSIADGVFRDCGELVSVTFPSTLRHIGKDAFEGCTNLEYIELPEGLENVGDGAFRNCTWMQEVSFPLSLTNIGAMAFANCTMLESVECYDGLQSVGAGAFSNCWRMLSVALPTTVDTIGVRTFYNCKNILGVTVPAHVETLAQLFPDVYQTLQSVAVAEGETELVVGFFSGCKMIEEVALSNEILEIPDSTFEGCAELRRMQFPTELLRIGNRAFYGCGKLSSLEFPNELVSVGNSAFYGCGQVNDIEFGENLREIGDDAFNGLPKVRDITCPSSVRRIGARAFSGVWDDVEIKLPMELESLGANAFANCPSIRRICLPVLTTPIQSAFPAAYSQIESLKILGAPEVIYQGFCQGLEQLSAIQIPSSVTNVQDYAFSGLSNLASVELPPNIRTIGEYSFSWDSRLTTIALPQSVEAVGYCAFYGCSNVRIVSCSGEIGTMSSLFPSAYWLITTVSINEGSVRLMEDLLSGCSCLSGIDIPLGVTNIGARAFKDCLGLSAFGVPSGVITLGNDVFSGCTALASLSLPEGLECVPSGAFRNCRSISSIVIPASVDYVGSDVFYGCSALVSVSYLGSCPQFNIGCYNGTPSDLVSYVVFGSRGWDGLPTSKALPEYWPTANARAITYWEPNTFEATFDGNGGTPITSKAAQTTGMTYVVPEANPEMLGARFDGWWTQPVNGGRIKTTTKVEVTRAQTFYAHWNYNSYSVRFDANGGVGEMGDQLLTVNTPVELDGNCFIRKGYRFDGWALSLDGEVKFADCVAVENLSFVHNSIVPLYAVWSEHPWGIADYLNANGLVFSFDGDAEWVPDDNVCHDGFGSMRSGAILAAAEGGRTTSTLRTSVVGTGNGSFWWKVDCEPDDGFDYFDYCIFRVDDVVVAQIAGKVEWERVDYEITGKSEHVLEWEFSRDDWDDNEALYENAAWVDEFEWVPTPVVLSFDANGADGVAPHAITKYAGYEVMLPLPSALTKDGMVFRGWSDGMKVWLPTEVYTLGSVDTVLSAVWEEKVWTLEEAAGVVDLTFETGGDAAWMVDLTTNYDGVASIRSGVVNDNQSTWIALNVSGPGTITFRALVSGEYYRGKKCDYLKFEIDGVEAFSSYDANWSNVVVAVEGNGMHFLKWTYLKNASRTVGYDCAWLDDIAWIGSEPSVEPIPDIGESPTPEQVMEALHGVEDPRIASNITNAMGYVAYRRWALAVTNETVTAQTVKQSDKAWLSFALGTDALIVKELISDDVKIEAFTPAETDGKFEFTVGIEGVNVGAGSIAEETLKTNLKEVFGLEGGSSLQGLSSDNVDITFGTPKDGKVKLTAGPNDANADATTFFMKVKMNP